MDPVPETAVEIAAAVRAGRLTRPPRGRARAAAHRGRPTHACSPSATCGCSPPCARPTRSTPVPTAVSSRSPACPIAIKDNVAVAGEAMRSGSTATDPAAQPRDHEVVRRLRAAGAVVVGITNMPELVPLRHHRLLLRDHPQSRGTASAPRAARPAGSAAAVAAGTVPVAHANDGMGSIRIPAACCGLVGIKPGAGVVPSDLGNGSWFGMAENGPLATTVDDAALLLSVMAAAPGLARRVSPGSLRIALSTQGADAVRSRRRALGGRRDRDRRPAARGWAHGRPGRPAVRPDPGPAPGGPVGGRHRTGRAQPCATAPNCGPHLPARGAGPPRPRRPAAPRTRAAAVAEGGRDLLRRPRRAGDAGPGPTAAGGQGLGRAGVAGQPAGATRATRRSPRPGISPAGRP